MINKILKNTNLISYLCMLTGTVLLFTQVDKKTTESQYVTIVGISLLIIGIYRMAKRLPNKNQEDYQEPLVKTKKDKNK